MLLRRRLAALALGALAACGGSSPGSAASAPDLGAILPSDNEVPGWTRSDPIRLLTAAKAGEGYASGGVNGDAERFVANGLVTLGIGKYRRSGSETLELRVWEMGSAAAAARCWTDLVTNDQRYRGNQWSAVEVGEAGRISNTGTYWWVVARKGAHVAELWLDPGEDGQRQAALDFLKAVVAATP